MSAPSDPRTDCIAPDRLHGLDWFRAAATLAVVSLHAGIAYMTHPLPGLTWATFDNSRSGFVDAVCWAANGCVMPIFFLIGGFCAAQLLARKGSRDFVSHRFRRLVLPFLFGCVVILPLDLYAWLLGWAADGRIPLRKLQSLKFEPGTDSGLWGTSHLWFLQYLFCYCLLLAGGARLTTVPALATRMADRLASSPLLPLILTIPCALTLACDPQLLIGFRHAWMPLPLNLLFFAPSFFAGAALYHSRDRQQSGRFGHWQLAAAAAVLCVLLPLIRQHVHLPVSGWPLLGLCGLFSLYGHLVAVGGFHTCNRCLNRPDRRITFFAEASFWIYLFHHPLVGLLQVDLKPLAIPVAVKFFLVTATALALSLATYVLFVRSSWVGVLLSGRRYRPAADSRQTVPLPDASQRQQPVPPQRRAA